MQKVGERLGTALALPYTDQVTEAVKGLAPPGHRLPGNSDQIDDPDAEPDLTPAGSVRNGILALALELNTVLSRAATLATEPADRLACTRGAALAYELARVWGGRLGSYINDIRRDL